MKTSTKSAPELRKFGITMAVAFGAIAALFWWRNKSFWPILACIALGFLTPALVSPAMLRPIEWGWMKFAGVLGYVMTRVLLTLTFFVVITPLGVISRLVGKDLLDIRRQPNRTSFWVPVEPDGPCSRPEKPY